MSLEQAGDVAVVVDVDVLGRGNFGQARHGQNAAGQRDHKVGAGGNLELAYGDAEALGSAQRLGVVAKAVLRLGHAHRQVAKAVLAQLGELALGGRRKVDAIGAVDLSGNGLEGVGNIGTVLVGKLELGSAARSGA